MHLIRTGKLREELINDSMSKREELKYLLVFLVFSAVSGQLAENSSEGTYFIAESVSVVLITVLGVIWCYDANQQGNGKDFIKRFVSVSVPVLFKLTLVMLSLILVLVYVISKYEKEMSVDIQIFNMEAADLVSLIFFEIFYFWRIKSHIKIISAGANHENI